MADRIIQTETLQSIANALRGGASQSTEDKIEVTDFAEKASDTLEQLKGVIDGSLTSIEIPVGVTTINEYVFSACSSLESIVIPSGVTVIGQRAFQNCSSLESIVIPSGVTKLDFYTFNGCSSLKSVSLPSTISEIKTYCFGSIDSTAVINCGFAEGAVSGAPWGAPAGVTINYGVTSGAKGGTRATKSVVVTQEMVDEYEANLPKEELTK